MIHSSIKTPYLLKSRYMHPTSTNSTYEERNKSETHGVCFLGVSKPFSLYLCKVFNKFLSTYYSHDPIFLSIYLHSLPQNPPSKPIPNNPYFDRNICHFLKQLGLSLTQVLLRNWPPQQNTTREEKSTKETKNAQRFLRNHLCWVHPRLTPIYTLRLNEQSTQLTSATT